jgi:hypothetical protein
MGPLWSQQQQHISHIYSIADLLAVELVSIVYQESLSKTCRPVWSTLQLASHLWTLPSRTASVGAAAQIYFLYTAMGCKAAHAL